MGYRWPMRLDPSLTQATIDSLICKRDELRSRLSAAEKLRRELCASIAHVNATIALYESGPPPIQGWLPGLPRPETAPPKARIDRWFKGPELNRAVLDALRRAGGSATTGQIARAAMASKGVGDAAYAVVSGGAEVTRTSNLPAGNGRA